MKWKYIKVHNLCSFIKDYLGDIDNAMAENNDPNQDEEVVGTEPNKGQGEGDTPPFKACYWYHPRTQKIGAGPVKHQPGKQFANHNIIDTGVYLVAITPHTLELWRALSPQQKKELPFGSIKKAFYCPGKGCRKNDCGQSPCNPYFIGSFGKFLDHKDINICIRPIHWEALNKLYHGMLLGPVNMRHIGGGVNGLVNAASIENAAAIVKQILCESLPADSIFLVNYVNNNSVEGMGDVETVIKDGDAVTSYSIALN